MTELRIIDPFFREFTPPIWGSLTQFGDKLVLSTANYDPNPDAMWRPGFSISVEGPLAKFNMTLPGHTIVINAKAGEIIPEPTTNALIALLIVSLFSVATRHPSVRRPGAHCK